MCISDCCYVRETHLPITDVKEQALSRSDDFPRPTRITKQSSTEISPALGRIWFNFTNGTAIYSLDLYSGEVVSANVDNRIHYISKSLSPYL